MHLKKPLYIKKEKFSDIAGKALNVLYPLACPFCGELITRREALECENYHLRCLAALTAVTEPFCRKCGKPLTDSTREYCRDCTGSFKNFDSGRSLWIYDRKSADAVTAFKYAGKREYAVCFGELLADRYGTWIRGLGISLIVPVPLNRRKMRQRGYNQAALLARELSRRLGIPAKMQLLKRSVSTVPQKNLGKYERRRNLQKAFKAKKGILKGGESILLVDDIYTTGSTAHFCAGALKSAGAGKVYVLTLCIGRDI